MAGHETHYVMPRGSVDKPTKVLIVVAPYYRDIADDLIAGAKAEIEALLPAWRGDRFAYLSCPESREFAWLSRWDTVARALRPPRRRARDGVARWRRGALLLRSGRDSGECRKPQRAAAAAHRAARRRAQQG